MDLNNSLESLDLLTIASFLMQVQGWTNNSKHSKNIHTRLDSIFQKLETIENKLDQLLMEKNNDIQK